MDPLSHEVNPDQDCAYANRCCSSAPHHHLFGSELYWELNQCEPPQGECRRLIEVFSANKLVRTAIYANNV